jgi:DNA gyrase subunit A
VLFFSSRGMVYRMKVWRLPAATPQSPGKALINLLPLQEGETITSILLLPEDQSTWGEFELMFATRTGGIRRNALADFENINRLGKIAMKLDEGDSIVQVALSKPDQDVLLTTAHGQCIRFLISEEVRLFKGRDSSGVRGIRLEDGDRVISMAILEHTDAAAEERNAYLKQTAAMRRAETAGEDADGGTTEVETDEEDAAGPDQLTPERYAELSAREQFIITVSERGFGKRTSSYAYRTSGRGGKGITAMGMMDKVGEVVASFPIAESDQVMLVTDAGKLIRCPVHDVRITGRSAGGVRIFKTDEAEKVVSVERIPDDGSGEDGDAGESGGGEPPAAG